MKTKIEILDSCLGEHLKDIQREWIKQLKIY
jgi:hypothetical protein